MASSTDHLRYATDIEVANTHAHPDLKDKKAMELLWKALDARLGADYMEGEHYTKDMTILQLSET